MSKVLNFFISASILFFLIAVLIVYAFIPDPCGILFDENGKIVYAISKNAFFYSTLFIFILIQALFLIFNKTVLNNRKSGQFENILIWFHGMMLAINIFIILMVVFTGLANNAIDYSFTSIQFIAYMAPLIVILWLLSLPIFLLSSKKK